MTREDIITFSGRRKGLIYEKIKKLCQEKGISISSVEKELNLSNGLISKWNKVDPSVSNLKKIADFFGKPIEYFLE